MNAGRYRDQHGRFEIAVPAGWRVERDGEGGLLVYAEEGVGLLHLMPFERDPLEEVDPAEELYAFLADQEIELEEDEVEDVDLSDLSSMALCEYVADEDDESVYWLVGVATTPGRLVFASYSCAAEDEDLESGTVRTILGSLTLDEPEGSGA